MKEALYNEDNEFFHNTYLGFIVIKPIPNSLVGFSLLRTYNYSRNHSTYNNFREFWSTRIYKLHLYGHEIEIDSLAFQQQDSVLSACATVSIWVLLQKASKDPYIQLETPGGLTKKAGIVSTQGERLIPNKEGLSIPSICEVLTHSNLETVVRTQEGIEDFAQYLKSIIYAYSPLKIPMIFLYYLSQNDNYNNGHSVAITGHNIDKDTVLSKKKFSSFLTGNKLKSISLVSEQISKIYVHDDQWGPFARMEYDNSNNLLSPWNKDLSSKSPINSYEIT